MRKLLSCGIAFNSSATSPENLYKLTGNEEQKEWEVFDFNARMFDPALMRFNSIDPLADANQESWNPYHYNYNNPVRLVDPTGLYSTEEWKKDNGITDDDLINVYSASDSEDEGGNPHLKKAGDQLKAVGQAFANWWSNLTGDDESKRAEANAQLRTTIN